MDLTDFFNERLEIARSLTARGELSLVNTFNTDLPRIFVVASASHFETVVASHIRNFFAEMSNGHPAVIEFVDKKVLFRSYHTLFNWPSNSVSSFFAMFGKLCADHYKQLSKDQDWLSEAARAFLQLGQARNELVHGDFATHSPSLTAPEVQAAFISAQRFVESIPLILRMKELS